MTDTIPLAVVRDQIAAWRAVPALANIPAAYRDAMEACARDLELRILDAGYTLTQETP